MKYQGYIYEPPTETDFVLGASRLPIKVINPNGQWDEFLPTEEPQKIQFETYGCVHFGTLNAVELLEKKLYNM